MSDQSERSERLPTPEWLTVADAIYRRINELSLTKAEVTARSGVSDKSLTGYLNAAPIVRRDKRRGLSEALWGRADAIDRILAGKPAVPPEAGPDFRVEDIDILVKSGGSHGPTREEAEAWFAGLEPREQLLASRFASDVVIRYAGGILDRLDQALKTSTLQLVPDELAMAAEGDTPHEPDERAGRLARPSGADPEP